MRRPMAVVVLVLVLVLSACGGDNGDATAGTTSDPGDATPQDSEEATTSLPDDEFPCSLVSHTEAEQIAGNSLDPGDALTNNIDENGTQWVAQECTWPNFQEETPVELTLQVSRADDFPDGEVGCPPLPAGAEITGIGDTAYWAFTEAGDSGVGDLRVCTADTLISTRATGLPDEAALQAKAKALAETAMAQL